MKTINARKRNICILTSVHDCRDPRIFYKEALSLSSVGHSVCIIASNCETHVRNNIKIIGVGRWKYRTKRLLYIIPRILWESFKVKADIYHIHDPELLIIAPIMKLLGAKIIYDIHEDFVENLRCKPYIVSFLRYPLSLILGLVEKVLSKLCFKIIAERYYKERYPDAIEVLNYSDRSRIISKQSNYKRLDLDDNYQWYLYMGNVTEDRGALTSLKLLEINGRAGLAYIGKCNRYMAEKIRKYVMDNNINESRVEIVGESRFVDPGEIAWYGITERWVAGIALFPESDHLKRRELTKFYEYMEMGLPIIASDYPVWRKLIEDNRAGYVVNLNDKDEIYRIMKILEADSERIGRREDLIKLVRNKFCWSIQDNNLMSLYNIVASKVSS